MNPSFWEEKKVYVTGHTGFKGAWLCQWLLNLGADVTGYSLAPEDPSLFSETNLHREMASETGDIRDLESLKYSIETVNPDIVFHLAAQPIVRESYRIPVYTYETNVMGTVNLLEAARSCSRIQSIVNITTDKVYENVEKNEGYTEDENLCGQDPYSNSKSCSELVTYSFRKSFFSHTDAPAISTARSGNVIGGGDFAKDRIIPDCIRAAEKKETIIVRNPLSTRPYQHVLDCLSGYLTLAELQYSSKEKYEGNYNFGPKDEDCVNTGSLVDTFCHYWAVGQNWEARSDGGPHEATFLKLDCSKAKRILNWEPHWGIKIAVEKTVEWSKIYLEHGNVVDCMNRQIRQYTEIG